MSRFRFVFAVCYFTAMLLAAVYLRDVSDRVFYQVWTLRAEQNRLKQQLLQKQLQVEGKINPAAVSERLREWQRNSND
jgi:capsule polysaccharide export protein KpsE/RkpR